MQAHADLNLLGQGTSTHGTYNLIYDTDLDITWYDYMQHNDTWYNQVDWADGLSVTTAAATYDDWRLPSAEYCLGYNCTNSEMGHLFYTALGNVGRYDPFPNTTGCGGPGEPSCLSNTGDFQNLFDYYYWSGSVYDSPTNRLHIRFRDGRQWVNVTGSSFYAMAVRSGRAIVPEPISLTLFIIGGVMLGFRRMRKTITN